VVDGRKKRRPFTEAEEETILHNWTEKNSVLAKRLTNRSAQDVKDKKRNMMAKSLRETGVTRVVTPRQTRKKWTEDQTKFVREAFLREREKAWIAQTVRCSIKQVSEKIKTLKRSAKQELVADPEYDVDSIAFC